MYNVCATEYSMVLSENPVVLKQDCAPTRYFNIIITVHVGSNFISSWIRWMLLLWKACPVNSPPRFCLPMSFWNDFQLFLPISLLHIYFSAPHIPVLHHSHVFHRVYIFTQLNKSSLFWIRFWIFFQKMVDATRKNMITIEISTQDFVVKKMFRFVTLFLLAKMCEASELKVT